MILHLPFSNWQCSVVTPLLNWTGWFQFVIGVCRLCCFPLSVTLVPWGTVISSLSRFVVMMFEIQVEWPASVFLLLHAITIIRQHFSVSTGWAQIHRNGMCKTFLFLCFACLPVTHLQQPLWQHLLCHFQEKHVLVEGKAGLLTSQRCVALNVPVFLIVCKCLDYGHRLQSLFFVICSSVCMPVCLPHACLCDWRYENTIWRSVKRVSDT